MSIELLISRLIGKGASPDAVQHALSPAESEALSRRLRSALDDSQPGSIGPDRGASEDAMRLAAYLAGAMDAAERAAFEQELAESPDRREAVLSAAAWLDRLAALQEEPSATALARATGLGTTAPVPPRPWGIATVIEWLLPRPRLAIATSALATLAIASVGLDIALYHSPLMTSATRPPIVSPAEPPPMRTILPSDSMLPPVARSTEHDRAPLTAETINAINSYLDQPAPQQLQDLLATLARSGAGSFAPGSVRSITLQPGLSERLRQRAGRLPTAIAASLSMDGTLRLEAID